MKCDKRNKMVPDPASVADPFLDLHHYLLPKTRKRSRRFKRKWNLTIVDDWPEQIPIFVEELELYELYLGDEIDKIFERLK